MDFLTEGEKQVFLTVQVKVAELKTIIRFRELEKHIEEGLNINTELLTENELKEYKKSKREIAIIKEIEEKRRLEKREQTKLQNIEYKFGSPIWICKLFKDVGLCKSLNEAKKLIKQKGLRINKKAITDIDYVVSKEDAVDGNILLQRGKKQLYRISVR